MKETELEYTDQIVQNNPKLARELIIKRLQTFGLTYNYDFEIFNADIREEELAHEYIELIKDDFKLIK